MEATQIIKWEDEEEEETEGPSEPLGCNLEPVGRLHFFSSPHAPEKDFSLYLGKNVVGRMPDCSVVLPFASISKQHAVIEILAWDKAPILRDCGSLNGTQILRPPKVLKQGMSHRLRDLELILFGDLPCQYYRLNAPKPFVSRGPLTVEETPRVKGETQKGILLVEDSEEEVEPTIEEPKHTSSSLTSIVPESDEEGGIPTSPIVFKLDSDTDEEEIQSPVLAANFFNSRRGATTETEQPKADGAAAEFQIAKNLCAVKEKGHDSKVNRDAKKEAIAEGMNLENIKVVSEDSDTDVDDESISTSQLAGIHIEITQPFDFSDNDTDVEEEIPATPAIVPVKKRPVIRGIGTKGPGLPDVTHQQENLTDVEESKAPLLALLERNQGFMAIDSKKDEKEEISTALTLAPLKESLAITCNIEGNRAQPVGLLKQNQTSTMRNSDTDMKEQGFPVEKQGRTVSEDHPDKAYLEKSQPPLGNSDKGIGNNLPVVFLERSQASATGVINKQVEEKQPIPVISTNQRDVEEGDPRKLFVAAQPPPAKACETDVEEGTSLPSSAVADASKSQVGTEGSMATLEQKRTLEAGVLGGLPIIQVEQDHRPFSKENPTDLVVNIGIPWEESTQSFLVKEEKHDVSRTKDSGDNHDALPNSEDLDLQATQCFVKKETESPEVVHRVEDESTQAFLLHLPKEPGPSLQVQDSLDNSWDVLATQPFCPRELKALKSEPTTDFPENKTESCPFSPGVALQDQHPESPVPTEPQGIKEKETQMIQTMKKDLSIPRNGVLNCWIPISEISGGDQEAPDVSLPSAVPEPSASHQNPLIFQNPKLTGSQALLSPSSECPKTRQKRNQKTSETPLSAKLKPLPTKPKVKTRESSRKAPSLVSSLDLESHLITSTDQPISSEPTSCVTRGRSCRSSVETPELSIPMATELQPSASTDQAVIPRLTSQASRRRTRRSSLKTPEPGESIAPELQLSFVDDQPVASKSTSHMIRTRRSSVKTPEPVVPTAPELQPSTCEEQLVSPKSTSRVTRRKANRSSVKIPEPAVPSAPEHQLSTTPVSPEPTFHATRSRTRSSSAKTPEPALPASRLQPTVPTDEPIPLGIIQGRTHRSIQNPKQADPQIPELQPSTSTDQPEPSSRTTRGKARRSSVQTSQSSEPTLFELSPTNQSHIPETKAQHGQSKMPRLSLVSAVPMPATPKSQLPILTEQLTLQPIPQAYCSKKPKASKKHGSLMVTDVREVCSATPEPNSQSSRSQRLAMRAAKTLQTTPESVIAQCPHSLAHSSKIQKEEATCRSGHTPQSQPKISQSLKRSFVTVDSPPLQKRLKRGKISQKTTFLKEKEEETTVNPENKKDVVMPEAGKKRAQAKEEPEGIAKRSLRHNKPNQDSTAPKVLFTGVVDERGKQILLDLGGSLANSVAEASYLVTDRIRRTVKFLCALGRGIPILSLDWLYKSYKARRFLPPDDYIVIDPEHEKNFAFSLKESLNRAQERKLLEGYEIHVTPGVQPPPAQMGEIISCCGGTLLTSMPRVYKPQRVVITCSQDFHRCSIPFRVGLPVLSPEFLLTGVLKQEAKPEAFIFSTLERSST
ncbi:mediator of DNA damage checkpoint protein 1 [Suncus etruscus]|uniref:mediator of DNA damage checkpoint protein 1 n=1 Tax=Suncus etruscus TaxID=109475 RepID=UPI002110A44F|nr:mediator of DNA damage checkpoint protein 1 [Suncus etruscus]